MSKIKVIDALCGQGKSKALINYINSCKDTGKKFMYVTPFVITESLRVIPDTEEIIPAYIYEIIINTGNARIIAALFPI